MKLLESVLTWVIIVPIAVVGALVALVLLGLAVETITENSEQHDRCLKQATNGYEIRRCR